jgi:recombination protein RecT
MKQLAMRSGLYTAIKAFPIYKGQITKADKVNGYEFDFSAPDEGQPIGYYAFYTLANGYKEEVYWTREKVVAHRAKYSKARNSPWDTEFDAMACKTVLKQVLKDAPMSIEMQRAVIMDGATVVESEDGDMIPSYEHPISDEVIVGPDWAGISDRLEAIATKLKPTDYQNGLAIIGDKDEAALPVLMKTIEAAEKA